jgi:integral membrane protein
MPDPIETPDSARLALKSFRVIALVEGLSFVTLLGVAMPLKYVYGMPMAVRYVGMAHGILFLGYVLALFYCTLDERWSWRKGVTYFLASMIPFAAIWVDRSLAHALREKTSPA